MLHAATVTLLREDERLVKIQCAIEGLAIRPWLAPAILIFAKITVMSEIKCIALAVLVWPERRAGGCRLSKQWRCDDEGAR